MVSTTLLCHEVMEEQLLSLGGSHENGNTDSWMQQEMSSPWLSTLKRRSLILRTMITSPVVLQRQGRCFKVPGNYQQCDTVFKLKCLFKKAKHPLVKPLQHPCNTLTNNTTPRPQHFKNHETPSKHPHNTCITTLKHPWNILVIPL